MGHFSFISVSFLAWLAILAVCSAQTAAGETPESDPVSPPARTDLPKLVHDLNDDSFRTRERASVRLNALATGAEGESRDAIRGDLVRHYKGATSPEVRFRLYAVLLKLAADVKPDKEPGFLGIQMMDSQATLPDGQRVTSIYVQYIVPDSAAARQGLQLYDHIVSLEGKRFETGVQAGIGLPSNSASARFGERVRERPAGSEVELEVYSTRTRTLKKLKIKLGERPVEFQNDRLMESLANDVVKKWLEESP